MKPSLVRSASHRSRVNTKLPVQINDFLSTYVPQERNRGRGARRQQARGEDDSEAESEEDLADGVNNMNVDGERAPKEKYMKLLRQVANRQTTEVVIELSDLKKVSQTPR
jgi:DNA replication licensing factor MCM7